MLHSQIRGLEKIVSPGLLVDPVRVSANIGRMIDAVGGAAAGSRLRPHVKTHKMPAVIELQRAVGIDKFKVATLMEAEMVARCGATDVLLAHQVVGPKLDHLVDLVKQFPQTRFSTIVDDAGVVKCLAERFAPTTYSLLLYIDVDCGMHRTGIEFGGGLDQLREQIESTAGVRFGGLHVYDGHVHDATLEDRRLAAEPIIAAVRDYQQKSPAPNIIGGGTPTFPIWAAETSFECSPGTPILWDVGYDSSYPGFCFEVAACLLTRVISKPGPGNLCFDLGYKAVSSEMPLERRLMFPELPDAKWVGHSEEHLVVSTSRADEFAVGHAMLAYPRHICPTVALYPRAHVIRNHEVTDETWEIAARGH